MTYVVDSSAEMGTLADAVMRLREGLHLSQEELAARADVSRSTVQKIEANTAGKLNGKTLRKLATALEMSPQQLEAEAKRDVPPLGVTPVEAGHVDIPQWDIDLRASEWADVPRVRFKTDDADQAEVIERGRFRLRVLGTCMEPVYPDGSVVEFLIIRLDLEPLVQGADYAICRSDGTATFKTFVGSDADAYTLAARNQAAYPGTFTVARQEVCRVAKVVATLTPPPPPKLPKIRRG